jgi:opacity protein-like surface antigen
MPIAVGLLLTTALLVQQGPGEPAGPPQPTERPHKVGIGGFGGSGGGASFRYFLTERIGIDMDVAYNGAPSSGGRSNSNGGSTFRAAPSAVFMFTKTHPLWDVDIRPYAGVGFNYAYTSRVFNQSSTTQLRNSGLGMQAFGGTEITFSGVDRIAISAQVAYYRLAVQPVNLLSTSGTDFYLMFHYYVK